MPLQLLRKTASAFTPNAGSNISLDGDHLKCDDYVVSGDLIYGWLRGHAIRPDGSYYALTASWLHRLYKIPADLSGSSFVNLSDVDEHAKYCVCADNDDNVYLACAVSPGHVKKYQPDGTWLWTYAGAGSTPGNYFWAYGLCFYDNRIFSTNTMRSYIFILNKSGNLLHEIDVTAGGSGLTKPYAIWADSSAIYVVCNYGQIGKWDVDTYAYLGKDTTLCLDYLSAIGIGFRRLQNGDIIINNGINTGYSLPYMLLDSEMQAKRDISFVTATPSTDAVKGGILRSENSISSPMIDETNKTMWMTSQYSNHYHWIVVDMRDASERYATLQHNFGSPVNIKRLFINALPNNTDESWKSMRLWYQIDAGGWNEVDLKNPLLNINGQNLELMLGMTSYGFLRNWPKFFSIDILYETQESAPDVGERSFDILDVSTELEVIEL